MNFDPKTGRAVTVNWQVRVKSHILLLNGGIGIITVIDVGKR
jgi:hypothetical protein